MWRGCGLAFIRGVFSPVRSVMRTVCKRAGSGWDQAASRRFQIPKAAKIAATEPRANAEMDGPFESLVVRQDSTWRPFLLVDVALESRTTLSLQIS
ncbi:hypothetical protein GCM10027597_35960 [Saccharopolyspora tripterygii]